MKRPTLCFAGVSALLVPQYSCHPGTPQENYAASKHCFATLNANLVIQSADRFRQAGLNRDAVVVASDGNMNAAYDLGKLLGMSPAAVFKDIERAKAAYTKSHTEQTAGNRRIFHAFGDEVTECLLDFYGRPND